MSKFILITIILLLVTWISDHQNIGLKNYIPNQLMLSVSVSVDFLSNISGVFLTISIFCFTTIVTVLNKYSSSISPRMLQRFIDKTGVLRLYGIFVSGFFYSVLSILLLQDLDSDQNVVAGSFGIVYSIIAMLGFIIFSKQVIDNIKMSNVIEGVFNDCDKLIDEEVELRENAEHYKDDESVTEIPLVAQKTGYFFKVKTDEILKNLNTIKSELTITKRIGEYVVEGEALGILKIIESKKLDDETEEELREEISQFLVINIFNQVIFFACCLFFFLFLKDREDVYDKTFKLFYMSQYLASERENFARLIHDEVLQDIFAAKNYLSLKEPKVHEASDLLTKLNERLRKIMKFYQTSLFEDFGMEENIHGIFENVASLYPYKTPKIDKKISSALENLRGEEVKLIALITKELVNNIYKHSEATYIFYRLYEDRGFIIMEVESDGMAEGDFKNIEDSKRGVLLLKMLISSNEGEISYEDRGRTLYTKIRLRRFIDENSFIR